tara:strand:- start:735 stop:1001 length:267 start_codon:yes stop_codon:yes gene_type:complete
MKTFSKSHIDALISEIAQNEDLNVFAGNQENGKIIIKNGLKIRHKPTGLVYTVLDLLNTEENGLSIVCSRVGKKLLIPSSQFKNYERQ